MMMMMMMMRAGRRDIGRIELGRMEGDLWHDVTSGTESNVFFVV